MSISTKQMSATEALDFHHFSVNNAVQAQLACPEASCEAYRASSPLAAGEPRATSCGKASREPPSPRGSRRHLARTTEATRG